MRLRFLVVALALAFSFLPLWADDGPTLYAVKCAACHGVDGAGKPAARIPSLISPEVMNAKDSELTDIIGNGGPQKKPPHDFQSKGVTPDQIRMIIAYIRELQKK